MFPKSAALRIGAYMVAGLGPDDVERIVVHLPEDAIRSFNALERVGDVGELVRSVLTV